VLSHTGSLVIVLHWLLHWLLHGLLHRGLVELLLGNRLAVLDWLAVRWLLHLLTVRRLLHLLTVRRLLHLLLLGILRLLSIHHVARANLVVFLFLLVLLLLLVTVAAVAVSLLNRGQAVKGPAASEALNAEKQALHNCKGSQKLPILLVGPILVELSFAFVLVWRDVDGTKSARRTVTGS